MGLEVDNCCFCIELRTGCLIIGYLGMIGNIILSFVTVLGLVLGGVFLAKGENDDVKTAGAVMIIIFCFVLLFLILNVIFNIVLLLGLHKNKRGNVKAYLIYTGIFLVIGIISVLASIPIGLNAGVIVRNAINLLLTAYFFVVIRSYHLKMDDPAKKPAIYVSA